ncbi:autophagy- protein 2 [Linderina pennispora]|nr:autophagy- protein 2 [Linderina pennispora]
MWPSSWSVQLPSWAVSNSLQKRLVKFLLRRTVGQFLKTELDDANLDVQLSSGQMQLKNVELSEESLNDAIAGLPIVVSSGQIGRISVSIPWSQLWTGNCELQIEELVVKAKVVDEADLSGPSGSPGSADGASPHVGKPNLAESVAMMTEGGASILTSSVFIADDFLRGESLGYEDVFLNKDVERMVANAHEERAQYYSRTQSADAHATGKKQSPWPNNLQAGLQDIDDLPAPEEPGGSIQGLQVVSEMVDRIISAVNIRVKTVRVECAMPGRGGRREGSTVKVTVDSVEFKDERTRDRAERRAKRAEPESAPVTPSTPDGHPVGIEYKVVEFHTLSKVLEIQGLHVYLVPPPGDTDVLPSAILSTFSQPIAAHLRMHRRMPFSELAPVQPADSQGRRRASNSSESLYMGPMPGEFREAKPIEITQVQRVRNRSNEDALASGWDVSVEVDDIAVVVTKEQLAGIADIAEALGLVAKQRSQSQEAWDKYQKAYREQVLDEAAAKLARWVSLKCRHIYMAVVPAESAAVNDWHKGSLAVLRLKLEAVKHIGVYMKRIGTRWESSAVGSQTSSKTDSPVYLDTEFWAERTRGAAQTATSSVAVTTAYVRQLSIYDSDPTARPVVQPLISIDRSLVETKGNSEMYDIWAYKRDCDAVLSINIGPVCFIANKELADRLSAYRGLFDNLPLNSQAASSVQTPVHAGVVAQSIADDIDRLMGELNANVEDKAPSNIAVCSPLIRTWIQLPTTAAKHSGSRKDEASGHFCVDFIDAVITNVVKGTATSSRARDDVPDGHMRDPHIQELLESRKNVAGSGIRLECEELRVSVQAMEGSSKLEHIGSVHEPSDKQGSGSIPRPHIEVTTVPRPLHGERGSTRRPPAFDAFSSVDDDIRVRMAPESEHLTSIDFERMAVEQSQFIVSCHLPEIEVQLGRTAYKRINAIINEFLVWQAMQDEEAKESESLGARFSVLVDMPVMRTEVDTSDEASVTIGHGAQPRIEQRITLLSTRMFITNAMIESGRMYVSGEANQVRLSSYKDSMEVDIPLSHSFATPTDPMSTPQVSVYMLTTPSITQETEVVLKTAWTTFEYSRESTCLRDLESFFTSTGTSGLVQPPPKPMRLSLNVRNTSLRWHPNQRSLRSAVISLDSLAVIVGLNLPGPDRDREKLRYYIEGLTVLGQAEGSHTGIPSPVSSDMWVETGRFWRDYGYAVLVHADMIDVGFRTKEEDIEIKLGGQSLVVDACADSIGILPGILQSLVRDIKGEEPEVVQQEKQVRRAKRAERQANPQVLEQATDDIFGDIEDDAFLAPPVPHRDVQDDYDFTYDFEHGRDDVGKLMEGYFAPHRQPDTIEEYEVVGGGAVPPAPPRPADAGYPSYSRSSKGKEPLVDVDSMSSTSGLSSDEDGVFGYSRSASRRFSGQREFSADDIRVAHADSVTSSVHGIQLPPQPQMLRETSGDVVKVSVDSGDGKDALDDKFEIIDNYFAVPAPGELSEDNPLEGTTDRILTVALDVAKVEINLHSGQDWYDSVSSPRPRNSPSDALFLPSYLDELNDAPSSMQSSVYGRTSLSLPEARGLPISPKRSPRLPMRRSVKPKVRLRATQVHVEFDMFAESSALSYDLGLSIGLLEVLDEVESSEWSKMLTRRRDPKTGLPASLHSLANARNRQLFTAGTADSDRVTSGWAWWASRWKESSAEPMVCVRIEAVRPYAGVETEELRMDVEICPIRCYIHQEALDFILSFFEEAERNQTKQVKQGAAKQLYFQIVRVAPLNVIFDYKPRRIRANPPSPGLSSTTKQKPAMELLNFFPLEDAEMTLSTVKVRGVAGVAKLVRGLGNAWLPHLTQTQIPGVVSGVTPIRSLVNLGSGVADLVILPLEQYRKDGRLVQGIKRGAKSFARTTALEAIQLGAKVAVNTQTLLEQAGDILNVDVGGELEEIEVDLNDWPDYVSEQSSSTAAAARRGSFGTSKYARQPENISDGVKQAYASLRSNVGDAVQTILAIPVVVQEDEEDESRSAVHGSVRAVVRAVPVAVLKPMIGATEAVSKTLLGLRNTMEPARRGQLEDKYKNRGLSAKKSYPL